MRTILVFLLAILSQQIYAAERPTYRQVLIRGVPVSSEMFPEAVYIKNNVGDHCSATIVGKRVILTAAHCLEGSRVIMPVNRDQMDFVASCEAHPLYEGYDYDIALCKADNYLPVRPASLSAAFPRVNHKVLLSGFGCTRSDRTGGNDGTFRTGLSTIYRLPAGDNFFYSYHDAAICSGDSGGAAYHPIADPMEDMHWVMGVNSRGNMSDLSMMTAVFTPRMVSWIKSWAKRWNAPVCGMTKRCDPLRRPPTPVPE